MMNRSNTRWLRPAVHGATCLLVLMTALSSSAQPLRIDFNRRPGVRPPIVINPEWLYDWSLQERLRPGVRWLQSFETRKCLVASGTSLAQGECGPAPAVRWMFHATGVENTYVIQSLAENTCLTTREGQSAAESPVLSPCHYGESQRFQVTSPTQTPAIRLRSLATRGCLVATARGAAMTSPCGSTRPERWQPTYLHRTPRLLSWYHEHGKTESANGWRPVLAYRGGTYRVFHAAAAAMLRSLVVDAALNITANGNITVQGSGIQFLPQESHLSPIAAAVTPSGSMSVVGQARLKQCQGQVCDQQHYYVAHLVDEKSRTLGLHSGLAHGAAALPGQGWALVGLNLGAPLQSMAKDGCTVLVLDSNSRPVMRRSLGLPADVYCRRIVRVPDGGFVVAADAGGPSNVELVGLSPDLSVRWRRTLPTSSSDHVDDLRLTRSGDLLVAGTSTADPPHYTQHSAYVIKAALDGTPRWRRTTSAKPASILALTSAELTDGSVALLIVRFADHDSTWLTRVTPDGSQDSGEMAVEAPGMEFVQLRDMVCHADDRCLVTGQSAGQKHSFWLVGIGELRL